MSVTPTTGLLNNNRSNTMYSEQTTNYDNLKAGEYPVVQDVVTIASGAALSKGSVLALGSNGKYSLAAGTTAIAAGKLAILLEDADAASADKTALVALTGEFNEAAVTFGEGATIAINKVNATAQGIFFKKVI